MKQYLRGNIPLFLLLLFAGATLPEALAQEVMVQGRVTSAAGEGLPGATVLEKGTANATATDASGRYSLSLSGRYPVLVVSYTGYQTRELALNGQTTLDIQLTTGEAVAVGYGTRPPAALTGAVAALRGEALTHSPALNVTQNLAGRIPGLTAIGSGGGEPGNDGASLLVRGVNSFSGTNPLIVVDGVPGRSLQRLDPQTIESISVLKDASAAIYGMQAANGVILVTTKRGQTGKPALNASFNQGLARPTRLPEMADAATYATLLNEWDVYQLPVSEWAAATQAYQTTGVYTRPDGMQRRAPFSPQDIRQYADGYDPWGHPITNWYQQVFKPRAAQHQGNLSVSGGGKRLQYYAALSTRRQQHFFRHNDTRYNQHDFRTNLDGRVTRYLRLGLDLMGRMEDQHNLPGSAGLFTKAMHSRANEPANGTAGSEAMGYDRGRKYVTNTNFRLEAAIPWIEGLSLTGQAAVDKAFFNQDLRFPNPNSSIQERKRENSRRLFNGLLNYERAFSAGHAIHLLTGAEMVKGSYDQSSATRYPDSGSRPGASSFEGASGKTQKAFGRLHYGFRQKYLAEFAWAYQATSAFAPGNRSGFFPGVSVGYVISAEDFWQHLAAVNYFKLRASYGQTGYDPVAIGNTGSGYGTDDGAYRNATYMEGREGRLANPGLTWEKALQRNIGFDAGLLSHRLSITADYFDYRRTDIIRTVHLPSPSGFSSLTLNDCKASNRGFDLGINYQSDRHSDFTYQVGLNGGYAKNRVLVIDEAPGNPGYQRVTGHSFSAGGNAGYVYYQATGIYHGQQVREDYRAITQELRPGDILFRDVNNDGEINALDRVRSEKTDVPTWTGGITLRLGYKGFDFSALVQGAAGAVSSIRPILVPGGNYLQSFADARWTLQNPKASVSRAFRGNEYWAAGNTYWLHKTDYMRLKQIELGYTLPEFTQKYGIKGLRVYVNAFNLLTYSPDYQDFDPELSTSGSGHPFPLLKIINGGLSLTF